ncbi:DNA-3-methyladenine glycosylase family protein [Candidatus Arthromitus sp. SFB-rat-Yit]|uniref:DNA-3-methyladenine glycosylase family protein n=1 Tax=Candidatus Arthromitus sp. SFB-rat-Yit TaxID=1041504 RepID=UPI003F4E2E1B
MRRFIKAVSGEKMYFEYGDEAVEYLKSKDKKLAWVIDHVGHIDREVDSDLFSSVVHHIIGQQISTKAHRTIWQRMNDYLGKVTPETINSANIAELQSLGMTFRKAEYIKDFSEKVTIGKFDLAAVKKMSDTEAIDALVNLKGIGVWTAEMILIFCLQRPNILSFGDLAILRGMRMVYQHREIDRKQFEKYRKRLSPYGSVASLYFWAVAGGTVPGFTDPAPTKKLTKGVKNNTK